MATSLSVGIYAIVVACSESLLLCTHLPVVRLETMDDCEAHVRSISPDLVDNRPVIMGRCRSWSPPVDWHEVPK